MQDFVFLWSKNNFGVVIYTIELPWRRGLKVSFTTAAEEKLARVARSTTTKVVALKNLYDKHSTFRRTKRLIKVALFKQKFQKKINKSSTFQTKVSEKD
jgi:hypothetical protein